jgi:hypothetical protein
MGFTSNRLAPFRHPAQWAAAAFGVAGITYGAMVATSWVRYGRPSRPAQDERDALLDGFMPGYDVAERHHALVHAPAGLVFDAATGVDLQGAPLVGAIIRAREVLLGAQGGARSDPKGLLADMLALGWGVLAETPGREVVVGAATQPWLAHVVFRPLAPQSFAAFDEPGFVKIAWTLRVDPVGPSDAVFRTETRVVATDATARRRFRWYWARFSPGIVLIRHAMIAALKRDAERRVAGGTGAATARLAPS